MSEFFLAVVMCMSSFFGASMLADIHFSKLSAPLSKAKWSTRKGSFCKHQRSYYVSRLKSPVFHLTVFDKF